jgi:hypothetical protein
MSHSALFVGFIVRWFLCSRRNRLPAARVLSQGGADWRGHSARPGSQHDLHALRAQARGGEGSVNGLCECGCGQPVTRRFAHGHNRANRGEFSNRPILVDDIDRDLIEAHPWSRARGKDGRFYAIHSVYEHDANGKRIGQRTIRLHRLVLERILGRAAASHELADHINGDGLDDRRSNLRLATHSINAQNRKPRLKPRGATFHKSSGKWQARAGVNRKMYRLGLFDTADEAARVAHEWRLANMPGYVSHEVAL